MTIANKSTMTEERRVAVEKAINSPFMEDFSENTLRIRRNLLAASSIALFYKLGGLKIGDGSTLFGIKLEGLTPKAIDWGLSVLLIYLLLHFAWNSLGAFHEWRLRATGAKMIMRDLAMSIGSFGGGLGMHDIALDDTRQSTLFTWFDQHRTDLKGMTERVQGVLKDDTETEIKNIQPLLEAIEKEIPRMDMLEVGLGQFGKSFRSFLWNQSTRWLVLEWGLPLILGVWAIGAVWKI